jgi:nitrate reductase gamma subunit
MEVSMSTLGLLIGGVLPYFVIPAFIAGMGYRFWVWSHTSQPAKLTLFPAAKSFRSVLAESFFFPSLFRGDRVLWSFAWLFHATLALVLLGHIRVFSSIVDPLLRTVGMSPESIDLMSSRTGGLAGIILLATGLFLLLRRLGISRVREISVVPDFLAPLLVVVLIVTGDLFRFTAPFDLEQTRNWAHSLLTFSPVIPDNGMFLLHLMLAQILIVFIPFSKILHFGGIFFIQAIIKRSWHEQQSNHPIYCSQPGDCQHILGAAARKGLHLRRLQWTRFNRSDRAAGAGSPGCD